MQLLTPPEKVELGGQEISAQRLHKITPSWYDRTGYRTPQRGIPLAPLFPTNAPVGTYEHLSPTNPCSCHENNDMSAQTRRWCSVGERYVQVVPHRRDGERGSFWNGEFCVHPPGGTDNRFREREDVIFRRDARHFWRDGMESQQFLCTDLINFALV